MKLQFFWIWFLAFTLVFTALPHSQAASSDPKPETADPKKETVAYNEGVTLLKEKKFAAAQAKFEQALAAKEKFAEAHNNLAYVLRKQGADNFPKSLTHYNRAIELNRKLPEPYMYRGVLYTQMGKKDLALADHATLLKMKSPLAAELEKVIATGKEEEPEQFYGVSASLPNKD
jgi:Flp pilus assembly protein TadD